MTVEQKRILLVEDEALIAMAEKDELESYGYLVQTVASGEQALEAVAEASEDQVDLILMDINLGDGMDGTEAAECILAGRDVPVVFLSSHTDPEVVKKTEKITSYGYVVKNSGITVLDASIKMAFRLFEAKKATEETARLQLQAEERGRNLNRMLASIRNVNALIFREKDRVRLMDGICRLLTKEHGFRFAWIILTEQGRPVEPFFHAGMGSAFAPMADYLLEKGPPVCAEEALRTDGVVVTSNSGRTCAECPLVEICSGLSVCTVGLRHGSRLFGWISVVMPEQFTGNRDEQDLVAEVAGDISFALWSLETEIGLQGAEDLYRKTIDVLDEPLHIVDGENRIVLFNRSFQSWCEKLGIAGELAGNRLQDTFPFLSDEVIDQYGQVIHSGEPLITEERNSLGGREIITETRKFPVDITGGKPGVLTVVNDITERKLAEDELKRSETMLKLTERLSGVGGWVYDVREKRIAWTDEVYRIYDLSRDEYDPNEIESDIAFYAEEDRLRIEQAFQDAVTKGTPYDLEMGFVSAKGRKMWVRTLGRAVKEKGSVVRVVGNIMDITARKEAEAQLRMERDRAQTYLDVAGIMFVAIDREGRVTLVNRKGCDILGRPAEEIVGKNWFEEFLAVEDIEAVQGIFQRMMTGELDPVEFYENPVKNTGGDLRLIAWHNTILRDRDGHITGSLSSGEDITERRQAEEELKRTVKEKQDLLRELQHRIKNSFAMIASLISLMKSEYSSGEAVSVLDDLGLRTAAISQMYDLLYQSDSIENIRLNTYLDRIVSSCSIIPDGVKIIRNLSPLVVTAKAAVPLGLIVTELMTNAFKYAFPSGREGSVTIVLEEHGSGGRIEVADNGIGFPEGFDPALAESMGLTLARSLAKQIEGKLVIQSEAGVRCILDFPLARADL